MVQTCTASEQTFQADTVQTGSTGKLNRRLRHTRYRQMVQTGCTESHVSTPQACWWTIPSKHTVQTDETEQTDTEQTGNTAQYAQPAQTV